MNDQNSKSQLGIESLGFHWSLVLGHWSFPQSLARLKVADRNVLVVLQLELILDGRRLFAVAVGGDHQIPAQQIGRAILADIGRVVAERQRGREKRHTDGEQPVAPSPSPLV